MQAVKFVGKLLFVIVVAVLLLFGLAVFALRANTDPGPVGNVLLPLIIGLIAALLAIPALRWLGVGKKQR
jgi:FtsH-binding integral membrane protein